MSLAARFWVVYVAIFMYPLTTTLLQRALWAATVLAAIGLLLWKGLGREA